MARCELIKKCTVRWGKRCNRQGGKKVPRLRVSPHTIDTATAMAGGVPDLKQPDVEHGPIISQLLE